QREEDLLARIGAFVDTIGHPNVPPGTTDSSGEEEDIFGQDPAPFLDYGSDDEPEFTPRMECVEAFLRDPRRQQRPARGRDGGRPRVLEDSFGISGAMEAANDPVGGLHAYGRSVRTPLEGVTTHRALED